MGASLHLGYEGREGRNGEPGNCTTQNFVFIYPLVWIQRQDNKFTCDPK